MDSQFINLYNDELLYLRGLGGEFARDFPKIAGRLGLDGFACADPYVERLLEGFAFLTARVRHRLDAGYPQLYESLLEVICPSYLAPTPALVIAGLVPDMKEGALYGGYRVPRGTLLKSGVADGQQTACLFSTAFAVALYPLVIDRLRAVTGGLGEMGLPAQAPEDEHLQLGLRCLGGEGAAKLRLDSLRVHWRGDVVAATLYEQLQTRLKAVYVVDDAAGKCVGVLPPAAVAPVGFRDDEALLPDDTGAYSGYRLLREYFAFPDRFLFVDINGLRPALSKCSGKEFSLIFALRPGRAPLPAALTAENARLFAVPAANVFMKRCDHILLDRQTHEYHLVADRTRAQDFEIYRVNTVRGLAADLTTAREFRPLYAANDGDLDAPPRNYYLGHRRQRLDSTYEQRHGKRSRYSGSEMFISLTDGGGKGEDWRYLAVSALCTNRDLPFKMPRDLHGRDFTLEVGMPVERIACLSGPTPPRPALAAGKDAWKVVGHLSLNYLSLSGERGAAALREMLALYSENGDPNLRDQTRGLTATRSEPLLRRLPGQHFGSLARGLGIKLTFDERAFAGLGVFLLGRILAEFFRQYASINSFVETALCAGNGDEIARWEAAPGKRSVL
ncbi:MAG: type VI secretion system baseplate subunit TssF [Planctomycetota bacterium]|jgi:type VI secretion system protein ImpG|nr:type VI secretion system baseplate subunit TssF [Planctomycetota bacterium]